MVLSNKKLKKKLRTALTESLTAVEASKATGKDVPSDANPPTFKELLGSATQKPRMTKREKRREKMGSLEGFEGPKEKKMKTHVENGVIEAPVKVEVEIGEVSVEKKEKKKKTQKKKKKQKKTKTKKSEGEKGESKEEKAMEAPKLDESEENNKKVYVGGIPYYSTEDDIRSFFESCGTIIEMDCMTFPESGKFRGIALLTFKTEAAAKRALALDGADMGGLYLKIQPFKAATRPQKPDFEPKIIDGYNRIYVGNLSYDITEDELKMLFSDCKVSSMRLGKDKTTGEFRGYAHVDFNDSVSLAIALKLDQKVVCGRPVRIQCAVPKKETEAQVKERAEGGKRKQSEAGMEGVKKKRRQTCYECGVPGHLSSSCPRRQIAGDTNTDSKI
ncbi:Splicing factor U2af large subunit B [Acorus calamus]|uniref:Splicing factor U2af large subunit B n=1 Tax=Acorus calamus TaxID=4465 RepID=A0AAV9F419_ACOCL|nr:Splicing factor U2af large subunit B [Acorus calamus]